MALSIGFIFMATRDDVTLSDARAYIEAALALGVVNLGFKDVGLPRSALRELAQAIRAGGMALVSALGASGSALSPTFIGWTQTLTGSLFCAIATLATAFVVSLAALAVYAPTRPQRAALETPGA